MGAHGALGYDELTSPNPPIQRHVSQTDEDEIKRHNTWVKLQTKHYRDETSEASRPVTGASRKRGMRDS